MAKLTKQTVAAVSKGKKETVVAKPKTGLKTAPKVAAKTTVTKAPVKPKVTKAVAKTPVKTPRKTTAKLADKAPVKPVETPKIPAKAVLAKSTLSPRTKKVADKASKPRKPRSYVTDTSKLRKYNNQLRENLRNLIYDKGHTIAKIARKMGLTPTYLFNVLRVKDKQGNGSNSVIALDIAYAVCDVIGAHISSVLPEAEIVNPVYKSKNDLVEKLEKLEEENKQLDFLYTQTKNQLENKNANYSKVEAKFKKLERIKDRLTALVESIEELEESKS